METLTTNVHGGLAQEHFIRPLKVADRFQPQASAQVRNDLFPHVRAQLVVAVNVRSEDQTRNAEVAQRALSDPTGDPGTGSSPDLEILSTALWRNLGLNDWHCKKRGSSFFSFNLH